MFGLTADGNRAVFEDITPALEYYQQYGAQSLLDISTELQMKPYMVNAFKLLRDADCTADAQAANAMRNQAASSMLRHEQENVLQPSMYNNLLVTTAAMANGLSDSNLQSLDLHVGAAGWPGSFVISPPDSSMNVADFSQRWDYASYALDIFSTHYDSPTDGPLLRNNIDRMTNPSNLYPIPSGLQLLLRPNN